MDIQTMHKKGFDILDSKTKTALKLAEKRRDIQGNPDATERTKRDADSAYLIAINNVIETRNLLDALELLTYEEVETSLDTIDKIISIAHQTIT